MNFEFFFLFISILKYCSAVKLQCFVSGQCLDSEQLGSVILKDENECLSQCQSIPECKWFTFYTEYSLCKLYKECIKLDTVGCPACISGERDCVVDTGPLCWITGECLGTLIDFQVAANEDQCLDLCLENNRCTWFTYFTNQRFCEIFSSCLQLDESCTECLSGERTCEGTTEKGYVALVVGGQGLTDVEVFSPNGQCRHNLAPVPSFEAELLRPNIFFLNNKIFVCGADDFNLLVCWTWNKTSGNWTKETISTYLYRKRPGTVYEGKYYIVDDSISRVYDPPTNRWSDWQAAPKSTGDDPCLMAWETNFFVFGGESNPRGVQIFDLADGSWKVLDSASVPMDIVNSGCTVLPNGKMLVVGSDITAFSKTAFIFDPASYEWKSVSPPIYSKKRTSLVTLGSRVFAVGGTIEKIEEYNVDRDSWSLVNSTLISIKRIEHNSIPIPAIYFSHLSGGCNGVQ